MAISHANPGQPIDIGPLGSELTGARTIALFKSGELEVIRLILPAGKSLPPHKVPGEITIQCIEGKFEVTVDGHAHTLQTGQLLYVPGGIVHSLLGIQDASGLVTIVLKN